ncbi:MAG TPA: TRAM domain-containing protein, partial [Hyphomicrobium sp.]|nr:TRAM domain-containing protein [Hyphomicrobium sp.]
GYAQAFSFKYSPRPGTPAAGHGEQVEDAVKSERLIRLQAVLEAQQLAFNARNIGDVLPVLIERKGRQPGEFVGRSPYLQLVHVSAEGDLVGTTANVTVNETRRVSLSGVIAAA